jgi:hypothetical protein
VKIGATFSPDRFYRYSLFRIWNESCPRLTYVLLNPSQADEVKDDPTIKRCVARAINGGFGGIEVVNLFAMRSTYPYSLSTAPDPIGPDNDGAIVHAARNATLVVCGWGKTGGLKNRADAVLALIRAAGAIPHALKLNADGSPQHPLYLPYSKKPFPIP